ncbi:MAG: D-alanyl-D-alanine carboxypeptidase/D-alanyl-D-alanine-endopeptidase [Elusimicrobiota bacterium]
MRISHAVIAAICLSLIGCAAKRVTYHLSSLPLVTTLGSDSIAKTLTAIIERSSLPPQDIAILIERADGSVVYSLNAKEPMLPASTMKILTSMAVLDALGPAYRFSTDIHYTGTLNNRVLEGSLFIKGNGDPTLDVGALRRILRRLRAQGVDRFHGKLILDTSYFQERGSINNGFLRSSSFNPALSPLSIENNKIKLELTTDKNARGVKRNLLALVTPVNEGFSVLADTAPLGFAAHHNPQCYMAWSDVLARHQISCYQETLTPASKTMSVTEPAYLFSGIFTRLAAGEGWSFSSVEKGTIPATSVKLLSHLSKPLADILPDLNIDSNNFIAEMLLLSAASESLDRPANEQDAADLLERFTKETLSLRDGSLYADNGSGLSRNARLSPTHLVRAMQFADKNRDAFADLALSLPLAGWQGTLTKRLRRNQAQLKIIGKTGHIDYVSCLTGIGHSANGQVFFFAIMNNDKQGLEQSSALSALEREEESEWQRTTVIASNFRKLQDRLLLTLLRSNL